MDPARTDAPATIWGRDLELAQVKQSLQDLASGSGGLITISSEAGMGKSRLVEEVRAQARGKGLQLLLGQCWEAVDSPAFWPWVQILRQLVQDMSADDLARAALGIPREIAMLVPGLSELVADEPEPEMHSSRFDLFDGVTSLIVHSAAARPLVIVMEDLHAADESSLLLLDFFVTNYGRSPVLIVATYDTGEIHGRPNHERILSDIASRGDRITLGALGKDAVREIYRSLSGDDPEEELLESVWDASEGNPLFVGESVRMLTGKQALYRPDYSRGFRVPEGSRAIIRRRLDLLAAEALEILSVASVLGREFELSLLEHVSGIGSEKLLDLLRDPLRASLVREVSSFGRFAFAHILIRESLYEDLSPGKRMRLHLQTAEALEKLTADRDATLPQLAHHYFKAAQAADPQKTLEYVLAAARVAEETGAREEAARLYHRALMVAEQARVDRSEVTRLRELVRRLQQIPEEPQRGGSSVARFVLTGEVWTIAFEAREIQMKDSKGLRYIARLLADPGLELHALELVASGEGQRRSSTTADHSAAMVLDTGSGTPLLDATAKRQYRKRLEDLEQEIAEAEEFNDAERADLHRREYDALVQQLAGAVGLGGRDRSTPSPSERARVSVTKAIKDAVKRLGAHDLRLAGHLRAALQTGTFCSYRPDPRAGISWEVVTP